MTNLKTAVLTSDRNIKISDGWFVTSGEDFVYPLLLNPIPLHEANLRTSPNRPAYLLSGSLSTREIKCVIPPDPDDFFAKEEIIKRKIAVLSPRSDDVFYYRFFLDKNDNISFSSDFSIILDDLAEDGYISDHYIRVVYASLRKDAPLVIDSKNTICISPI